MIRFAPQAAKQPAVPQPKAQAAASVASAVDDGASIDLLLPDLGAASDATALKATKPRAARKQKADNAAIQLDLDA